MDKFTKLLKHIFAIAIVFTYVQTTAFVHIHEVNNQLTVHSHPFSNSSENHTHTSDDLLFIFQLSVASIIAAVYFSIVLLPRDSKRHIYLFAQRCLDSFIFSYRQLRAPPIA